MRLVRILFLFAILVLLFAPAASAQTAVGEVNGTVVDSSGAAVAGATVKLFNQATNIVSQATSNADGHFIFINVKPGQYVLEVEVPGFKSTRVSPFTVGVSQTVTQNIKLDIGAVTETVTVNAAAEMLEGTSSELGTVIAERAISELPLNGRNFTQLLTLTPGVTPVSTSQNKSIGGVEGNVGIPGSGFADPSLHGQQNRSKLYFFDGIVNTNIRGPTYVVIPNLDLVQEFKVVGQDSKAEFGGATGGVVDMVSKPGTNNIHGSLFEYVRNDAFDARDSLNDHDPLTQAPKRPLPFRQNQFGGSIGAPIIKNKTFISGGYDGWRYSKPSQGRSYVPTPAELNGDFSGTTLFATVHQIFNPYSTTTDPHVIDANGTTGLRDPFKCDAAGSPIAPLANGTQPGLVGTSGVAACNKLPLALINLNPQMQAFFKTYSPVPNYASPADRSHNFVQTRPDRNNSNGFQVRVDHRFRDKDNLFFRYTQQNVYSFTPIGDVGFTDGSGQGRNYGGGWVHTFTPLLILDVRAGYAGRPSVDAGQSNKDPRGIQPMKDAGLLNVDEFQGMLVTTPSSSWKPGQGTEGGNFGTRGAAPRENPTWSVSPNLSWLKGNHNLKTGFQYIHAQRGQMNTKQVMDLADSQTAQFTGTATSARTVNNTGMTLASALLGFPNNYSGELPVPHGGPVKFNYASWAVYVQDEWKISSRLTLTAGLRLDALTQPQTTDGRLWNGFDLFQQQYIIGAAAMPPLCSVAKVAPCMPDGPPLYAPGTGSTCTTTAYPPAPNRIPCDFRQDLHFGNAILAGGSSAAFPPVRDNWGPRAGIAWRLTQNTVLRGGYGLYWDSLPARSQYAQNGLEAAIWPDAIAIPGRDLNAPVDFVGASPTQQSVVQAQANTVISLPAASPWTIANFPTDPKFKDAYSQQWHVELQRQINPDLLVQVAYAGSRNGRLDYKGKPNTASQAFPAGTPAATVDALRPMPWVSANVNYEQSTGYSRYNALGASVHRRATKDLFFLLSYTWSKSIDVSSGYFGVENGPGGGAVVQNYFDQKSNEGVSGYDITHFLSWAAVYELPFGHGKRWLQGGPGAWILGDWQANPILQARSGAPYTLNASGDIANISGSGGIQAQAASGYGRPNIVADPFQAGPVAANPDPKCQTTISQGGRAADAVHTSATWFNPCAFTVPSGSFGNLGRTPYRGSSVFNMDFSMTKNIPLPREGMKLQLAFQSFNVFNVQNLDAPSQLNVTNASAGVITSLAQGTTPRELQFGLKFVF